MANERSGTYWEEQPPLLFSPQLQCGKWAIKKLDGRNLYTRNYLVYISITKIQIHFSCSYLARGIVDKLEVINKKWVRVRLLPGNTVEGAVSRETLQKKRFI